MHTYAEVELPNGRPFARAAFDRHQDTVVFLAWWEARGKAMYERDRFAAFMKMVGKTDFERYRAELEAGKAMHCEDITDPPRT